jgi:hypothetical protein
MSDISGKNLGVGSDFSGNRPLWDPTFRESAVRWQLQHLAPPFAGAHQAGRTGDVCLLTNGGLISVRPRRVPQDGEARYRVRGESCEHS